MCLRRSTSAAALILACCIASGPVRCEDDLFGLSEDATPAELYWEMLRLQADGSLDEQTFAQVQQQLDVVEKYYGADPDFDDQERRVLVAALRRTSRRDPGDESAHLLDAQAGRAYARRLHSAGVREAQKYAQRTIFIAGMLGVPTSKGELALIVALPAGGYLVGRVAALTYKKAALLLRKLRTPEHVLTHAGALGIRIERVESKERLEGLIGKEAVAKVDSAPHASDGLLAAAGGAARLLPPAIRVPLGHAKFGLEHILRRHASTSGAEGVSKFAQGMGHIEIRALIQEANATSAAWRVAGDRRVLDVGLGRVIGTDRFGNAASGLRIVTTGSGDVITAYPIPWP